MPNDKLEIRIPKKGDYAGAQGHKGTFVVSDVNAEFRTVDLALIGPSVERIHGISWDSLSHRDEEDESQNALRVMREATEA